jgi:hypothetical protein
MEHTALYDSALTGNFFVAATFYIKQCAPSRQLKSSETKVASSDEAIQHPCKRLESDPLLFYISETIYRVSNEFMKPKASPDIW